MHGLWISLKLGQEARGLRENATSSLFRQPVHLSIVGRTDTRGTPMHCLIKNLRMAKHHTKLLANRSGRSELRTQTRAQEPISTARSMKHGEQ